MFSHILKPYKDFKKQVSPVIKHPYTLKIDTWWDV